VAQSAVDFRVSTMPASWQWLAAAPLDPFLPGDFDCTLTMNVRSVFVVSQEAAHHTPTMPDYWCIINIGSTHTDRVPFAGAVLHSHTQ
jgi:3-oxoacyl-[acyl-carrier protein] reductase